MIIETKLTVIEFIVLVEAIADGFFGEDGVYEPHIGMLNTMRLFYNLCVKESAHDNEVPHDFTDLLLVEKLAADDDFVKEFDYAIYGGVSTEGELDFRAAYSKAIEIVETKKDTIYQMLTKLTNTIVSAIGSITGDINEDSIKAIGSFSEQIKNGNLDYYKLIEKFSNPKLLEKETQAASD